MWVFSHLSSSYLHRCLHRVISSFVIRFSMTLGSAARVAMEYRQHLQTLNNISKFSSANTNSLTSSDLKHLGLKVPVSGVGDNFTRESYFLILWFFSLYHDICFGFFCIALLIKQSLNVSIINSKQSSSFKHSCFLIPKIIFAPITNVYLFVCFLFLS